MPRRFLQPDKFSASAASRSPSVSFGAIPHNAWTVTLLGLSEDDNFAASASASPIVRSLSRTIFVPSLPSMTISYFVELIVFYLSSTANSLDLPVVPKNFGTGPSYDPCLLPEMREKLLGREAL